MKTARVVRPGALTTVQDGGRPSLGRCGVSVSGAMDPLALATANRLLGNPALAAALEITGPGLELQLEDATALALAGADLAAALGGRAMAPWRTHAARAGELIAFSGRAVGARAYLAFPGGLDVPLAMASAATDLDARFGGHEGRPLRRDDVVRWHGTAGGRVTREPVDVGRWYDEPYTLAVVIEDEVSEAARDALVRGEFRVGARSSRMGYRLEGPPVPLKAPADALSEPIAPGAIQVAGDGQPILLMADRQTVGGYPVVAHLARAHQPKAAQLWPGDPVGFRAVSRDEAQRLARELWSMLEAL